MRHIFRYLSFVMLSLLAACSTPQKTIYFSSNTALDPSVQVQKIEKPKEPIIQSDDIIAISITTISSMSDPNKSPVSIFSEGGTPFSITATIGSGAGSASGNNNAYRVDAGGYIDFPVLGKIRIGGLTIREAKDLLAKKLKDYVKEPVVEARIINYKVTVLGEINHPGFVIAPNQQITILDAIAACGDIPITGRKDNIMVIRETEGTREYARLNLNSKEIFNSPYYYLKQNDVVYIEPARIKRQQGNEFLQFYLPAVTSLLSTVLAVYGIVQISKLK